MKTARRLALLAAIALLLILPYAWMGYAGQDLPFHVSSWIELKDAWLLRPFAPARLTPGWSPTANFTLGDPHLFLYPPASFYLGALLTLLLPLRVAPAAFAWLALLLSGVSMYAASRPFVAERDRLRAAALYMLGPYLVTTTLVRFAAAELLVQAWLPLIALWIYQSIWTPDPLPRSRRALVLLGALLGLTWITNIPASIVLLYGFFALAAIAAWQQRSLRPLLRLILAESIAAALAAFYLLPVLSERSWISPESLIHFDPPHLLLFMPHPGFDDNPMLNACWIFLCGQTLLVVACLRSQTTPIAAYAPARAWASFAVISILFQIPLTLPLWQVLPELRFVLFPFRFLPLLGVALPLLLFARTTRRSLRPYAWIAAALLALIPILGYTSMWTTAGGHLPSLTAFLAQRQLQGGLAEYLPAAVLHPVQPLHLPPISVVGANPSLMPGADSACTARLEQLSPDSRTIRTVSTIPCQIRLGVYFYPHWRAFDESRHALPTSSDSAGVLLIAIPAGSHTVTVDFHPASRLRTATALLSLIAFILTGAALLLFPAYPANAHRPNSLQARQIF